MRSYMLFILSFIILSMTVYAMFNAYYATKPRVGPIGNGVTISTFFWVRSTLLIICGLSLLGLSVHLWRSEKK
ncbi:hypothetical protein FIU87_02730 [Bacillus sp. THAF10]|uniref:hypothetical protein n=1 Tax=Bacillus sp. THAF10 TaxID=2587848 RepID=UPI001268A5CB|nr:hypothetical protein [Bacillus sp. THAF10]QFT87556.1 hypothetical protein FIU87_02730 [Bacillus sp. THAF10]